MCVCGDRSQSARTTRVARQGGGRDGSSWGMGAEGGGTQLV